MLTSKQRQFLKGRAHGLSPVVRVGKSGLTPSIVRETRSSLLAHELIKVRVEAEQSVARRALAGDLAREAGAEVVGIVGKIAVLYRPRDEKPRIVLP
jgi:RNA-binding protein